MGLCGFCFGFPLGLGLAEIGRWRVFSCAFSNCVARPRVAFVSNPHRQGDRPQHGRVFRRGRTAAADGRPANRYRPRQRGRIRVQIFRSVTDADVQFSMTPPAKRRGTRGPEAHAAPACGTPLTLKRRRVILPTCRPSPPVRSPLAARPRRSVGPLRCWTRGSSIAATASINSQSCRTAAWT